MLLASIGLRSGEFVYITKAAPEWQPGMTFDQICDMLWSGIPEDDIEAQEEQVRLQEAYAIKLAGWEERHRMLPSGGHARGAVHQASDAAAGTAAGAAPAASASRRGVLEVSQDTVSGTGFKTYLGHVWSEEDWYEDYTTKPPRDNLGSWEVDKGVFATGYLLDRKFFPPKAGLPKAFGFFHHGVTGNKVVARSDEEDFSGQAKQALQRLAQLGPRTAADMGLATIKGAKKTATPRALPEHLQDQVQPKFQIREDSDPDSEADDDMTSCFTRMSGQTVSAEIAAMPGPHAKPPGKKSCQATCGLASSGSSVASTVAPGSAADGVSDITECASVTGASDGAPADPPSKGKKGVTRAQLDKHVLKCTQVVTKTEEVCSKAETQLKMMTDNRVQAVAPKTLTGVGAGLLKFSSADMKALMLFVRDGHSATDGLALIKRVDNARSGVTYAENLARALHPDKSSKEQLSENYMRLAIAKFVGSVGPVLITVRLIHFERAWREHVKTKPMNADRHKTAIHLLTTDDAPRDYPSLSAVSRNYSSADDASQAKIVAVQTKSLVDEHVQVLVHANSLEDTHQCEAAYCTFTRLLGSLVVDDAAIQREVSVLHKMTDEDQHDSLDYDTYVECLKIVDNETGPISGALAAFDIGTTLLKRWRDHRDMLVNDNDAAPILDTLLNLHRTACEVPAPTPVLDGGKVSVPSLWFDAMDPVATKRAFLYANTSKAFRRTHAASINRVSEFLSESWTSVTRSVVELYGKSLDALLSKGWNNAMAMGPLIDAMSCTLTCEYDRLAKATAADEADADALARRQAQRLTSIATWRLAQSVSQSVSQAQADADALGAGAAGALSETEPSQSVSQHAAVLEFVQTHMRCPDVESWTVDSSYTLYFAPMATSFEAALLADTKLSYMRKILLSAVWRNVRLHIAGVLRNTDLLGKFHFGDVVGVALASLSCPSLNQKIMLVPGRDTDAIETLRERMAPICDAFLEFFVQRTVDNVPAADTQYEAEYKVETTRPPITLQ